MYGIECKYKDLYFQCMGSHKNRLYFRVNSRSTVGKIIVGVNAHSDISLSGILNTREHFNCQNKMRIPFQALSVPFIFLHWKLHRPFIYYTAQIRDYTLIAV